MAGTHAFSLSLAKIWPLLGFLFISPNLIPSSLISKGHLPNPLICINRPMTFWTLCWSRRMARRWLFLQRDSVWGWWERGSTLGEPSSKSLCGQAPSFKREVSHHSYPVKSDFPICGLLIHEHLHTVAGGGLVGAVWIEPVLLCIAGVIDTQQCFSAAAFHGFRLLIISFARFWGTAGVLSVTRCTMWL